MAYKPKWSDFANEVPPLGPILPLSGNQILLPISGVLPSGENGGFDNAQYYTVRSEAPSFIGSGINVPHPYPNNATAREYAYVSGDNTTGKFTDGWWEASGIFKTYPSRDGVLCDKERESGIFHYDSDIVNGRTITSGIFSNGENVRSNQIEDFAIFNNYIHHQRLPSNSNNPEPLSIPYISTFKKSIDWNPYG